MFATFIRRNQMLHKNATVLPTHDDPHALADKFAAFFIGKVESIRQSIPYPQIAPLTQALRCNATLEEFHAFTNDEINELQFSIKMAELVSKYLPVFTEKILVFKSICYTYVLLSKYIERVH